MTSFGPAAARTTPGSPQRPDRIALTQPPRVPDYLRFIPSSTFPDREDVLRATSSARGYQLVTVVRSTDVSTLARGCSSILQISGCGRREIDGVLTLADYTIAWDLKVVHRGARVSRAAFGEGAAAQDLRRSDPGAARSLSCAVRRGLTRNIADP